MKSRQFLLSVALVLILALIAGTAVAGSTNPSHDFTEDSAPAASQTEYAIITFKDPPAASYDGGIPGLARTRPERGQKLNPHAAEVVAYGHHLRDVHANYHAWLNNKAPQAEVVREFVLTGNSVVVRTNGANAQTLQQGPGVKHVSYSALYQPTMNVSVDVIGASALWAATVGREDAGSGVNVGIIDSGIDDTHPFFDCKGDIQHKVYASGVAFDPSNLLVNDHGTHVAGTVAGCVYTLPPTDPLAGTTISGVAPGANLYDYNVFPGFGAGWVAYGGSAFSHDIAAAIEDAVADGMDVVNMSLGGTVQGPHDYLAEAADAAVDAGMVVVVAAGNEGPGGLTVGSPGSAPNVLTAGASTNAHVLGIPVSVTSASGTTVYVGAAGDFDPYEATPVTNATLSDWSTTGGAITACTAAPNPSAVAGTVTLISRGGCTFTTKVRNAQNAGAIGVVVYNNVAGPASSMGADGTTPEPTIPAVMVSNVDGAAILASLPATATISGPPTGLPAEADIIAGFSSRGPTPFTYLIKPDVTAPGVNIYSSVFGGEFAMFQGTSMATPHLTGSVALLLQLHPDWSPADVKSAITNTAARVVTDGVADPGVLARGNGRVDLMAANSTPLTLNPVSVSFGYWSGNKPVEGSVDVSFSNVSGSEQTCSVTVSGDPYVTASTGSFTLAAGESTTVTFTISAGRSNMTPSGDYDGDVEINCGGTSLLAPWWVRINR